MKSDQYPTDAWLYDIFTTWYDPCPLKEDWEIDGLAHLWIEKTFCNPPYSNPKPWVKHGIESNKRLGTHVVFLLKHDSSTQWYKMLHEAGAKFMLISSRLRHGTGSPAPFPSLLAVLH